MPITFDPAKSERNARERGLPFDRASDLDWSTALVGPAKRQEIVATRWMAVGMLDEKVHICIFTIEGDDTRVMSLRRASKKEAALWHAVRSPK